MAPPAPTSPMEMLSWSRLNVLFQQFWVWCPKLWCSSLELKGGVGGGAAAEMSQYPGHPLLFQMQYNSSLSKLMGW